MLTTRVCTFSAANQLLVLAIKIYFFFLLRVAVLRRFVELEEALLGVAEVFFFPPGRLELLDAALLRGCILPAIVFAR